MNAPEHLNAQGEQLITSMEFDNLLREETLRLAEFVPTLGKEELRPMLIAFLEGREADGQRKRALMPVSLMSEGEGKQQTMMALGASVAQKGLRIVAAFMISEAWMKRLDESEAWRIKSKPIRASQAPDRQETLVVMGRTVDRRVAVAMAPIHRNETGTRIGEWDIHPCKLLGEQEQDNILGFFFLGFLSEWLKSRRGK